MTCVEFDINQFNRYLFLFFRGIYIREGALLPNGLRCSPAAPSPNSLRCSPAVLPPFVLCSSSAAMPPTGDWPIGITSEFERLADGHTGKYAGGELNFVLIIEVRLHDTDLASVLDDLAAGIYLFRVQGRPEKMQVGIHGGDLHAVGCRRRDTCGVSKSKQTASVDGTDGVHVVWLNLQFHFCITFPDQGDDNAIIHSKAVIKISVFDHFLIIFFLHGSLLFLRDRKVLSLMKRFEYYIISANKEKRRFSLFCKWEKTAVFSFLNGGFQIYFKYEPV